MQITKNDINGLTLNGHHPLCLRLLCCPIT